MGTHSFKYFVPFDKPGNSFLMMILVLVKSLSILALSILVKSQEEDLEKHGLQFISPLELSEQIKEVNSTLSKKIGESSDALMEKIVDLSAQLDELYHKEQFCKDGIVYERKCIFAIIQDQFDYDTCQSICQSMGGYLAYIDSEEKYFVTAYYLRNKLTNYYGWGENLGNIMDELWKKT